MKQGGFLSIVLGAALLFAGCGEGSGGGGGETAAADESGQGHELGANGGEVLGLGNGEVHVEFVIDEVAQRVDLYVLGADGKTALEIDDAPAINVRTAEGPKQIATAPASGAAPTSHFTATDPAFGDHHLEGQLVVSAAGGQYFAALPSHEHEDDHSHAENAVSFTAWTEECEWFVELENPEVGKPAAFAAHVTLLDSFQPVTSGSFGVEASAGSEVASASAPAPARPGIYTPSITFPTAGEWKLQLTFEGHGLTDTVEWTVTVHEAGKVPPAAADAEGVISFLKEQQWKIPFATFAVAKRTLGAAGDVLAVPATAVVDDAALKVVVVQLEGEAFVREVVEIGAEGGGLVEVRKGLREGDRVVSQGAREVLAASAGE